MKGEDQTGAQDVTDNSIETDLATRKLGQTFSKRGCGHSSNTQTLLKDETVKEEFTETKKQMPFTKSTNLYS